MIVTTLDYNRTWKIVTRRKMEKEVKEKEPVA